MLNRILVLITSTEFDAISARTVKKNIRDSPRPYARLQTRHWNTSICWNVALYSWLIQAKLCEGRRVPHPPNCMVSHRPQD